MADACIYLGYLYGKKGYKLLNIQTRKLFFSRNVIFHETICPFSILQDVHPPLFPAPISSPGSILLSIPNAYIPPPIPCPPSHASSLVSPPFPVTSATFPSHIP